MLGNFIAYRTYSEGSSKSRTAECDYGIYWRRKNHKLERWRLSYNYDTGELYAVMLNSHTLGYQRKPCIVIDSFPTEKDAWRRMLGYEIQPWILDKFFPKIDWLFDMRKLT